MRCAILAGGHSVRMGGVPKGLLELGGRRILDQLVDQASAAFGAPPLLIANHPDAATWRPDLTTVPDRVAGAGALGGLYTAVLDAPAPVVVVAWDLPFVTAPLLRFLAEHLAEADVVVPAGPGLHRLEPLCAGYAAATAEPIRAALERGDFRAVGFHEGLRVRIITAEESRPFGSRAFFNVNTPADLATARAWVDSPSR